MSPRSAEFGPLEMEVLGIVSGKPPVSVSEIQQALKANGSDLAYTTVMTVLVRLHKKGVLIRKKEGKLFLYSVARGRNDVGTSILSRIGRALFRQDRIRPILALLDDQDELTEAELKELRQAVDRRLKECKR